MGNSGALPKRSQCLTLSGAFQRLDWLWVYCSQSVCLYRWQSDDGAGRVLSFAPTINGWLPRVQEGLAEGATSKLMEETRITQVGLDSSAKEQLAQPQNPGAKLEQLHASAFAALSPPIIDFLHNMSSFVCDRHLRAGAAPRSYFLSLLPLLCYFSLVFVAQAFSPGLLPVRGLSGHYQSQTTVTYAVETRNWSHHQTISGQDFFDSFVFIERWDNTTHGATQQVP
ncbi:hypothetical protein O181_034349 [Austropuccinia psidii MF-1]|uniref:Uncharacterized protein n=1 Tax=Austropuccinia psidii MF-1 TaxID=1389203 RepID=A0A9Q3H9F7_9BASI|nr:hypothetical protein [Austropuccinia psidii MF-1]